MSRLIAMPQREPHRVIPRRSWDDEGFSGDGDGGSNRKAERDTERREQAERSREKAEKKDKEVRERAERSSGINSREVRSASQARALEKAMEKAAKEVRQPRQVERNERLATTTPTTALTTKPTLRSRIWSGIKTGLKIGAAVVTGGTTAGLVKAGQLAYEGYKNRKATRGLSISRETPTGGTLAQGRPSQARGARVSRDPGNHRWEKDGPGGKREPRIAGPIRTAAPVAAIKPQASIQTAPVYTFMQSDELVPDDYQAQTRPQMMALNMRKAAPSARFQAPEDPEIIEQETPWMDGESIPGLKNKTLLYVACGLAAATLLLRRK